MNETIAVKAEHLYKVFGKKPKEAARRISEGATRDEVEAFGTAAVIDASFEVKQGEIFVVMGLSGSGKSTLIRMLNGLLEPTSGTVTVAGTNITAVSAAELRRVRQKSVSMVFQHFALLPHRTVLENAAYGLEVQGVPKAKREAQAQRIVELVGLSGWEQKLPSELSGGMQQRVGIARALTAETDVLLMDEAFSALDPLIRREMQEQLVELQAELGKTIIFITHDLNEAMFLGDRIAVMRDGRIVQVGTPEEILTDPANDYVAQFVQDVDRTRVLTASSVMEPAYAEVALTSGPRNALRKMRDLQTSAVFVVGRGRQYLGVVRDRDVMRQVKNGESDLSVILRKPQGVSPDAPLVDLVEPSIESGLPLAVISETGKLLGTIPKITLLAALGNVPLTTQSIPIIDTPTTLTQRAMSDALSGTDPESSSSTTTASTTDDQGGQR
ncbi:betaine/proline/choline family ABC transporter ATP-binding protein [Lysinibacter cavernae]|uniref:Glycine betaine/proline transport system ATP-binding protein n=1 Tax=Lysinibacter cavernae TaxID=1640652 RepID=A0A7X5TUD3_9MICO|nr:glycine betaine/proline transport system ATP-binding protein [Lysinibacter cavernae]